MRIPSGPVEPDPPLERCVAACIAAIAEVALDDVPVPPAGAGAGAWTRWRTWLSTRGLGLVPIAEPRSFSWPGPWVAVLAGDDGEPASAVVAFGAPPGIIWRPLGGEVPFERVVTGHLVAPADVALWAPRTLPPARESGVVELVAIAEAAEAPMRVVQRATAIAGRGLEGDRYVRAEGTFSDPASTGHELTLIEAEAIEALTLPGGAPLEPADARRNLVTRGIDLDALVGRRFRVGDVECAGRRLCEPCAHLERLTEPGTLRGLVHRGGLRADILTGGVIERGATVRPADG